MAMDIRGECVCVCVGMRSRPPHAAVMRREEDRWDTGDGNGPRGGRWGGGS